MVKPTRNGIIAICHSCRNQVDLTKAARIAELSGVREVLCPHCNRRIGKLN